MKSFGKNKTMNRIFIALGIVGSALVVMSSTCTGDAMPAKTVMVSSDNKVLVEKLNEDGIHFDKIDLAKATEKAAKENKMIFIDAYTTWCGPCKIMAKTTFKDPDVADFFNKNFVNIKIEMEKDADGPDVARKYKVRAYPTLLIIRPDGSLVKQVIGLQSKERLMAFGKSVL